MKPFAADGNEFMNACRKKQEQTSSQNELKPNCARKATTRKA